jgi:hypothetical protein
MRKQLVRLTMVLAVACAAVSFASRPAQAACPFIMDCPMHYDPVICDDGNVYGNSCVAEAACATGCEPYLEWWW